MRLICADDPNHTRIGVSGIIKAHCEVDNRGQFVALLSTEKLELSYDSWECLECGAPIMQDES